VLDLQPRDAAAEIDVGREIAEQAADPHRRPQHVAFGLQEHRHQEERRHCEHDRQHGAGDKEESRRARIEVTRLQQLAAQLLGVAALVGGIVLRGVVDQPLRRDLAGVAQRARIVVGGLRRTGGDFRRAPLHGEAHLRDRHHAERERRRRQEHERAHHQGGVVAATKSADELEQRVHVRSGNCTSCT
jgi:hypothetical protein